MRVCIIGAGAAGLCVARHVVSQPGWSLPVVYELNSRLGGTWVYNQSTGPDHQGRPSHSSMYKHMRTNLPKEIMAFPDYPFPEGGPSFVHHSQVLAYLEDYAHHYQLKKVIKFNTMVEHVKKNDDGSWSVQSRGFDHDDAATGTQTDTFDAVFVCNGHYSDKTFIPELAGLDEFKGQVFHSHYYREPDPFAGKRVACLGTGPSGVDIAIEVASVAKQVYLCHNQEKHASTWPERAEDCASGFERMTHDGAVLTDGRQLRFDVLILCTGYRYDISFLDPQLQLISLADGHRLYPLYQHLLHVEHPTLFLIGVCAKLIPFPWFDVQTRYALTLLHQKAQLPSKQEMYEAIEADLNYRMNELGMPERYAHIFSDDLQWDYFKNLAELAQIPNPITPAIQRMFDLTLERRDQDFVNYKKDNFRVIDSQTVEHILWQEK